MYKNFILEIDALDNGVTSAVNPAYKITTGLGVRVSRFNKPWNAPNEILQSDQFKKAMRVVEEEFLWQLYSISQIFWPARKNVEDAWHKRESFHPSGELILFEVNGPWKDHLYDIEAENGKEGLIKFAFYQDDRKMWRIQTIPQKENFFSQRVSISKAWRGLRNTDFKSMPGFEDMEFVHASGFIGGAWSIQTCLKMAEVSLAEHLAEQEALKAQQETTSQAN